MKSIYKFVAGGSVVTPVGLAIAVVLALVLRGPLGPWSGAVYVAALVVTLALASAERPG